MSVGAEELLAPLDEQQRRAATSLLGPVCILAGAGTGKTRAITHRIAYGVATGVYPPNRVLALTFTSRAAGELRARLRMLGTGAVPARTFHAAALSQLGYFWPQVVGGQMPALVPGKARLIAHAADGLHLRLDTAALRDLAAEVEWRKVSKLSVEQWAARAGASTASGHPARPLPPRVTIEQAADLMQRYEDLKDERRQLDFEDVLLAAAGMIAVEERVAQQVREQYRFFVVDEYQDVNPLQHDLLALWLGDRDDVCVVGDASQTIYSFTGATSDYLLRFGAEHPQAPVLRLESNYRSTGAIVETANRLVRGRAGALDLRAVGERGLAPVVTEHASDVAEASAVAAAVVDEIVRGTAPSDIAVLFRVNAQSAGLEAALARAGVSTRTIGAKAFFDRPEVQHAMSTLHAQANLVDPATPLFQSVSDMLRVVGWTHEAPAGPSVEREKWENLDAIMSLVDSAPAGTTLRQFVDDLRDRQQVQHAPAVAAVTLATLHSAKGLEWPSVHLVGLSEGLVPISYATTPEAVDEERRLLYVGVTRARTSLRMSWAARSGGSGASRRPSRFLADLG
ncbi:ATP-dependent helicase [Galbitalea sp. SE-J8]|uniref:ATP-dependent helicase n=1 Tax=Galbitalea sp. SE-J8 TaxID=3054952 RepID=UPI00259CE5EF|nr:ATP-dependent helicase [Galbitalea sp. SE-J8]MDM4763517.1 ATP-dependent helicase [Galbitalea sp. SE-J8]